MEKEIVINMSDLQKELIIRKGEALPLKEPQAIQQAGNIQAPWVWAAIRGTDPQKDNVRFSRKEMKIVFTKDEKSEYGDEISGSLLVNDDLVQFQINSQKTFNTADLAKLLKVNRMFFSNSDECAKIVTELNSIKAKVSADLEQGQDDRGNKNMARNVKVDSNVPLRFALKMPIFVGFPTNTFMVEICMDATDRSITLWMESVELNELVISGRDKILNEEIEKFVKSGLPVIEY
ncbi:MAG: hypothetical protein UT21_C0006G0036 [Candidatus Woesebacteria bacterium GW2011_GWA1_39_11b]|nr:MAG: hypothetical protein UT21_C0006G0036 [Candidatus Woesebacteria bacterium GW2011_GWA1_39_11b]KKS77114.1 MAG: hypothetical protein UV51_C0010G0019 [Candidatus Woesebacteria bacterium GW2011_GWC1_42_9]